MCPGWPLASFTANVKEDGVRVHSTQIPHGLIQHLCTSSVKLEKRHLERYRSSSPGDLQICEVPQTGAGRGTADDCNRSWCWKRIKEESIYLQWLAEGGCPSISARRHGLHSMAMKALEEFPFQEMEVHANTLICNLAWVPRPGWCMRASTT